MSVIGSRGHSTCLGRSVERVPETESDYSQPCVSECVRAFVCVFPFPLSQPAVEFETPRKKKGSPRSSKRRHLRRAFRLSRPAEVQDYYVIRILLLLATTIVGESGDRDRV